MPVLVLTFLGFIAFQAFLKKSAPQPPATHTQNQSVPAPIPAASPAPAPSLSPVTRPNIITKQASSETETVIENDLYRITFTNRGAQVKSWILKKFDNEAQNGLLDLVNPLASQKYGYPLSLWTYDEALRNRLNSALYVGSGEAKLTAPATVTFEYSDQELSVRKTFHFDHSYLVNVETAVTYKGSEATAFPAWPAGFGDQVTPASYAAGRIDYHNDAST